MIFDALWRLERKQRALARDTDAKIKVGIGKIPKERLDELYKASANYVAFIEVVRQRALSDRLRSKAWRLNVPVPPETEWETGGDHNPANLPYMTPAMQAELRRVIRQEQKERREIWTTVVKDVVVPIGGIIISVLSLMIAWAALHLKH